MDNVMATPDPKTLAELAETLGLDALYKLDPDAFASAFNAADGLKSRAPLPRFFDEPAHTATFGQKEIVMSALSYLSWVDAATQIREGKLSSRITWSHSLPELNRSILHSTHFCMSMRKAP